MQVGQHQKGANVVCNTTYLIQLLPHDLGLVLIPKICHQLIQITMVLVPDTPQVFMATTNRLQSQSETTVHPTPEITIIAGGHHLTLNMALKWLLRKNTLNSLSRVASCKNNSPVYVNWPDVRVRNSLMARACEARGT